VSDPVWQSGLVINGTTFTNAAQLSSAVRGFSSSNQKTKPMKTLLILTLAAAAFVVQSPKSNAQSPYQQGEVTVDTFATHTFAMKSPSSDLHTHDGVWGYGLGGSYFFHRNFGLGAEAVVLNGREPSSTTINEINFSLTARVPIGDTGFAPYVNVGAGRNIENGEYLGHAAAGLEFRFLKHFGVFGEGRYQWVRQASDSAQVRAGLRFAF
jgi:hypothetical protein